jgi:hypothetical protein
MAGSYRKFETVEIFTLIGKYNELLQICCNNCAKNASAVEGRLISHTVDCL